MPRLPFWGLGAAAVAGVSYESYHLYAPHRARQLREEEHLTRFKQQYQDVLYAHARLRAKVEEWLTSGASSPAVRLFTNAEKTVFFCDVQLVRGLLWALPHHLTTESDLHRMFSELSMWERQHCTELHFRDTPLSLSQTLRSVACFALYIVLFRVAAPLLGLWDGFTAWQAQLLHHTARFITETLEINVVMESSEKLRLEHGSTNKDARNERDQDAERKDENLSSGQDSASVCYLTFSPVHWIEEVGFWACASNPLLIEPLHKKTNSKDKSISDDIVLRLLRVSPFSTLLPTSRTSTMTYAQHWRQVAAEKEAGERSAATSSITSPQWPASSPSSSPSLVSVAAEEVSFGYPFLLSNELLTMGVKNDVASCVSPDTRYIPVGVSSLPHLLYLDPAHAVTDVQSRRTREEVYTQRLQAQLVRSSSAHEANTAKKEEKENCTQVTTTAAVSVLTELQLWRAYGGIPWWRRAWWGGVYGGSRLSVAAPSHTLRYHLGKPCTAANYVTAAIEASRAAENASRTTS